MRDPFKVLGVPPDVGLAELRRQYLALVRTYHPDAQSDAPRSQRRGAESRMKEINAAYDEILARAAQGELDNRGGAPRAARMDDRPRGTDTGQRTTFRRAVRVALVDAVLAWRDLWVLLRGKEGRVTDDQAARRLAVPLARVHELIRSGELPATHDGERWIIADMDFARFLLTSPHAPRPPEPPMELRSRWS